MAFVISSIPKPEDYRSYDPSVSQKTRPEVDTDGNPLAITVLPYAFSGRDNITTVDYNAGAVAQTMDARGIFGGAFYVQNAGGAANLALPTLVNFKQALGHCLPNFTAVQRTAAVVGGQNYPGSQEFYVEFEVRNSTASAITVVINGDGLITVATTSTAAARMTVAANLIGRFRISCNNLAGTGAAFFVDRVA